MRIGIIGTGFVSSWAIDACRKVNGIEPVVLYSRTAESGNAFALRTTNSGAHQR